MKLRTKLLRILALLAMFYFGMIFGRQMKPPEIVIVPAGTPETQTSYL